MLKKVVGDGVQREGWLGVADFVVEEGDATKGALRMFDAFFLVPWLVDTSEWADTEEAIHEHGGECVPV